MSRRILSVFLAFLLIAGFSMAVKADVTGSFDISIQLSPEGTQTEAVKLEIDLQSNLDIQVTLSGLTFGADLGFGTTGVEFAILSLSTNLGALQVFDEFVFAEPFGCPIFDTNYANWWFNGSVGPAPDLTSEPEPFYNDAFPGLNGSCPATLTMPIGDRDGDGQVDLDAVGFVKKRITLEINIAGVTLTNLALFEDVDFPDIQMLSSSGADDHEHDHFDSSLPYDLSGTNSAVDDQTPTYGFGDVISISGQTVSGITVSGSTTFCAGRKNYIKKRSWTYEVNKACTSQLGTEDTPDVGRGDDILTEPIGNGAKTPLLFEEETLDIEGIQLGSVGLDVNVVFRPLQPVNADITATFSALDIFDVTTTFSFNNLTALSLGSITSVVSSGNFVFTLVDNGGDLQIDTTTSTLSVVLNPNQNPADLTVVVDTALNTGITGLQVDLGVNRSGFTFRTTTKFGNAVAGTLSWSSTTFSFDIDSDVLAVGASLKYGPTGMGQTSINLGVVF